VRELVWLWFAFFAVGATILVLLVRSNWFRDALLDRASSLYLLPGLAALLMLGGGIFGLYRCFPWLFVFVWLVVPGLAYLVGHEEGVSALFTPRGLRYVRGALVATVVILSALFFYGYQEEGGLQDALGRAFVDGYSAHWTEEWVDGHRSRSWGPDDDWVDGEYAEVKHITARRGYAKSVLDWLPIIVILPLGIASVHFTWKWTTRQPAWGTSEFRAALDVLEEARRKFSFYAMQKVSERVEASIRAQSAEFLASVRTGGSVRQHVYSYIANEAGDEVESGRSHIYRGVLTSTGEDYVNVFDAAIDELVKMEAMDKAFGEEQKDRLREGIEAVG
jgi:hypothetical protein